MANLTADRISIRKDGTLFSHPVAATTTIFNGSLVNMNSAGLAVPSADSATHTFTGKADTHADNSAGVDGDVSIEGHREGVFEFNAIGMTQADVNEDAFVVDDNTIGPGVVAQPGNVTGVTLRRIATSIGGSRALVYTSATTLLAYGGGAGVNVSLDGDYILTATDGSQIMASIVAATLPGVDASDAAITLRHVRAGKIAEVASATSIYVDILGAVRG